MLSGWFHLSLHVIIFLFIMWPVVIFAQPMNRNGKFLQFAQTKSLKGNLVPEITIPTLDNNLLKANEYAKSGRVLGGTGPSSLGNYHTGPFKFGHHVYLGPIDVSTNGTWFNLPNGRGRVWRLKISSPSAISLNFVFDRFKLPLGTEFYIHGELTILGAYTAELNNKPHMKFTSPPVLGKSAFLEYYEPLNVQDSVILSIRTIVHGFDHPYGKSTFWNSFRSVNNLNSVPDSSSSQCGASSDCNLTSPIMNEKFLSGNCEVNVICPHAAKWDLMMKSVVYLTLMDGSALCTGTLINSASGLGEQFLLTAHHCIAAYNDVNMSDGEPYDHDRDTITFNFQAPICQSNGTTYIPTDFPSLQGLDFLTSSPLSDFALLRVQDPIPSELDVFLAGWTVGTNYSSPEFKRVVAIHHPNGDVKKISYSNNRNISASCWGECRQRKAYHILVSAWDRGATEEGSSGSALYNNDGMVIGQLHGGLSNCNRPIKDFYGSFPASYSLGLKKFIDPMGKFGNDRRCNGVSLNVARAKIRI